jgi:tetrapyrrole methylase family protein/MazG family protein
VEKQLSTHTDALRDVPRALPALMRAQKLVKKAARGGMSRTLEQSLNDLRAFADALSREIPPSDEQRIELFGQMLLAAANLANLRDTPAETALDMASAFLVEHFANWESAGNNPVDSFCRIDPDNEKGEKSVK